MNLSFKNRNGETLVHGLELKNICVSTGAACNSQQIQISHVLQALKVPKDFIRETLRITFGKENSREDAEFVGEYLSEIAGSQQRRYWDK